MRFGLILIVTFFIFNCIGQKTFVSNNDVFGTRVFIENKGQFNSAIHIPELVKYAYESSNEHIYFTNKGLVYKLIKKFPANEEEFEKIERGKKGGITDKQVFYVNMNWLGANENIQIVENEKKDYYFTYGKRELNSHGFKKITYKNVYNNIDIKYSIPLEKNCGIKYSIILHEDADPSKIKISYSGDVKGIISKDKKIVIMTALGDIVEHEPISYYEDKEEIVSNFKLENKIISFQFPNGLQNNKIAIIDPWVTSITNLTPNNNAYDVDFDSNGNLFIYGGENFVKTAKYNSSGILQWTFSGNIPSVPWNSNGTYGYAGNFVVNKVTGKIYIGQSYIDAPLEGVRVIRLDPSGNYDNFVTPSEMAWNEMWDMGFDCSSGKVYAMAGGTTGSLNAGLIDQTTGSVTLANFTGLLETDQDVVSNTIDANGNIFIYIAGYFNNCYNKILRVNPTFNGNVWFVSSTYNSFTEATNKTDYTPFWNYSNGFNCLAVNNNYLFMYDGYNIAAYNKNTGAILSFTTLSFQTIRQQGGIAVDDCNNVYLGGNGNINCFNYDGTSFNSLPQISLGLAIPNQYIYDIKYEKSNNLLYVSGSGFAGVYPAANSCTIEANSCIDVPTNLENDKIANNRIHIIPNPNNGTFILQTKKDSEVIFSNTLGQIIKTINLKDSNIEEVVITDLPPGIYLVRDKNFNNLVQKIVVLE